MGIVSYAPGLNIAKMAKVGFRHTARKEMQYMIRKPRTEVREERKLSVEISVPKIVKAVMECHLAMLCASYMDRFLPCQHGTTKTLQTHWRQAGTGASTPTDTDCHHQN